MTARAITPDGFGDKILAQNEKSLLNQWRTEWADHVNGYLERAGQEERIDPRSLKDQDIERLPDIHMGPKASAMEKKGVQTERGDVRRNIQVVNIMVDYARSVEDDSVKQQIQDIAEMQEQ